MRKLKEGDKVVWMQNYAKYLTLGNTYTISHISKGSLGNEILHFKGVHGGYRVDHVVLESDITKKDISVSLVLTLEEVAFLRMVVGKTNGSHGMRIFLKCKELLDVHVGGRKLGELPISTIDLFECRETITSNLEDFFAKTKSEEEIAYDELLEEIKVLQEKAEKLNPNKSAS